MKMAGLCWMSVLLAVSLSIGDCEPLDIGYVRAIAELIQFNYQYKGQQFSVAVNIPQVPKTTKELEEAILPVDWDKLNNDLEEGKVYTDTNVVVAVPLKKTTKLGNTYTEHAEKLVLDNLGDLANTRKDDILVLYSWLSPCSKCTEERGDFNILDNIARLETRGKSFALVFHTVYAWFKDNNGRKKEIPDADIKKTFRNLRKVIKDDNIFRCYNPKNTGFRCVKCFVDASKEANPVDECVRNEE